MTGSGRPASAERATASPARAISSCGACAASAACSAWVRRPSWTAKWRRHRRLWIAFCGATLAGATIVKPAAKTFYGGYAGYFLDPDNHLWEVAFNPDRKSVV